MATASRARTRPAMASTPPPRPKARAYTLEEKQQLLDNFDLEVADKVRSFESHLALTLQSFVLRQDSEVFRIPRELRAMTLRDLQNSWGGSLGGTVKKMKQERIEAEERERMEREEEERKAREKEAKGKRKWEENEGSPGRSKNARKDAKASASTAKGGKRKPAPVKKGKSAPTRTSSSQPSGLPQNHIFNPLLPPTPKMPRAPRRGESFLSINGSPLARPGDPQDGDEGEEEEEGDSDDELPDPEAYEAKLTKSQRAKPPRGAGAIAGTGGGGDGAWAGGRSKRGPSLMIRQSLAPQRGHNDNERDQQDDDADVELKSITLKDGRIISFNPLNLVPGQIEEEMREAGLADDEREVVRAQIKDEVVKALSEKMERWSGLR